MIERKTDLIKGAGREIADALDIDKQIEALSPRSGPDMDERQPRPEEVGLQSEFESQLGMVSNPIFRRLFFLIRTIGAFLMVCCIVIDFTYLFKEVFSTKLYFLLYNAILGFRIFFSLILMVCWISKRVFGENGKVETQLDPNSPEGKMVQMRHERMGCLLYMAVPLTYFTGSYRMLDFRNFAKEVGIGLGIDLFLYILPMILVQHVNDATVSMLFDDGFSHSSLVKMSMILKFLMVCDLILEFIMFLFEIYKLNQLS